MSNLEFGKQVKRIRRNAGLSMEEFAQSLSLNKSRINMWENSGVVPREDVLCLIAKTYQISIDTLLGVEVIENESHMLQRIYGNLKNFDEKNLEKAEQILEIVFGELFSK